MKKILDKILKRDEFKPLNEKELSKEELELREKIEKEFYYKTILTIVGGAVFLVLLSFIIFFVAVEGEELTKVPNLKSEPLHEALIKLQEKALYPKITTKHSTPDEKGLVINQDISGGSVVKAGRLIGLTVSLGGVIDKVGSYEGQTITAVRGELKKLFSTTKPLLEISDNLQYVFSEEPAGTILEQDPPQGTEISEVTTINFVISSGPQQSTFVTPTMKDMEFKDALKKITQWPIKYQFTARAKREGEEAGKIVSQTPEPTEVKPFSTVVEMVIAKPEEYPANFTFGILEFALENYPVSVALNVDRVDMEGNIETIVESRTYGGAISIPYLEEVGSELVIMINGEEFNRRVVRQQ